MRKTRPLRDIRRSRGLNQQQVAAILGVSQQTYSKYESGRLSVPLHVRERLSGLYGISRDELFDEVNREAVAS